MEKEKSNKGKTSVLFYAGLGIDLVVSTVVGGGIGYILDKYLGTSPWLTFLFLILGAASGFVGIYRVILKMEEEEKKRT